MCVSPCIQVADAVAHGVLEPAAVATSVWSHAVDILRQLLRIDGAALAAIKQGGLRGAGIVAVSGGLAQARARPTRGARVGSEASSSEGSEAADGSSHGAQDEHGSGHD
jgi:hypothetical protein